VWYIIADQQKKQMSDALSKCRVPLSDTTNIPSNNNAIAASDTIATKNAVVQMSGNKLMHPTSASFADLQLYKFM
jgi:hypothetical protein